MLDRAERWARGVLDAHRAQLDAWMLETHGPIAESDRGWIPVNEAARRAEPHSQLWIAAKLLHAAHEFRQRLDRVERAADGATARREAALAARGAAFAIQWHLVGQMKRDIEPSALSGVRQRKAGATGGRKRAEPYRDRDRSLAALWDAVEREQPAWSRIAIAADVAEQHEQDTGEQLAAKTVQNIVARTRRK